MYKELTFVFSLLSLMAVAALVPATLAEESLNTTVNNTTMNNISLNNTTLNQTVQDQVIIDQASLNLSTVNNETLDSAPISDMAGAAPEMAAIASSAQVASDPEGVFKIGEGVKGRDFFEVKEYDVKTMEIGMPIKSLRDVGKMVFVCDIV